GWGLPRESTALVEGAVAFASRPTVEGVREVVARFPETVRLRSGFLRGEDRLSRKLAAVAFRVGKGRVMLYSFAPHFRGQTAHLFPLIYNALWLAKAGESSP
ncbi:MAG: hypothetical protein NZ869_00805, partial [Thermoanaerobaculum sp.]|nr:hypothetical protein [Thermoanaerobaculum sp.]MDW7968640.1 hypothetical protein [Thermoanaerobaculum sp.]